MLKDLTDPKEARDAMFSLLSTSGTLAGIGIIWLRTTTDVPRAVEASVSSPWHKDDDGPASVPRC
jgi:hypothetical protein